MPIRSTCKGVIGAPGIRRSRGFERTADGSFKIVDCPFKVVRLGHSQTVLVGYKRTDFVPVTYRTVTLPTWAVVPMTRAQSRSASNLTRGEGSSKRCRRGRIVCLLGAGRLLVVNEP